MKNLSQGFANMVSYIGSLAMFVFTAIIITVSFPDYSRFLYEFEEGETWLHNTLISEIDFPILKTEKEIEFQHDSIINEINPICFLDTTNKESVFLTLTEEFKKGIKTFYPNDTILLNDTTFLPSLFDELNTILNYQYKYHHFYDKNDSIISHKNNIQLRTENGMELVPTHQLKTNHDIANDINNSLYKFIIQKLPNKEGIGTFISSINIEKFLKPNINFDKSSTESMLNNEIEMLSIYKGFFSKGNEIIKKGDIIDSDKYNLLMSYVKEAQSTKLIDSTYLYSILGRGIIVIGCLLMIFIFLVHYKKEIIYQFQKSTFLLSLILLFFIISVLIISKSNISLYTIPYALIPIIIRSFYNTRIAIFTFILTMILISFIVPNSFEFLFLQIMAGLIAIFTLRNVRRRGRLFFTSIMVFVSYGIFYLGMEGIYGHGPEMVEWKKFLWFGLNALMILSALPLTYIYEKIFGFLSDVTLMELTDTNSKVLRMIAEKAPGTFQHSLQVANLAEEAIIQIGGNALLTRAGALYHDLGKIALPRYFIENQLPGQNPHDELDQIKSAEIIKGHVSYGIELARKYRIPEAIQDFIKTHHGVSRVEYFYKTYKQRFPNEIVDDQKFTYKGKLPFSRETAVVMMADAVEAASRSIKVYSDGAISDLVDNIIQNQISGNQLVEADITFRQISIAKDVFKRKLKNIYHSRIEYPK